MTRLRGLWTLEDRLAGPVREIAFEPPPGTAAVTVRLTYRREAGVLDLGCFGPDGFRGWSGGARSEYTITPTWATPGYLPGEIEPGQWHVLLGLYRVPPEGLPYEVRVICHRRPPAVPRHHPSRNVRTPRDEHREPAATRRDLPGLGGCRWLAGDLHAHTTHSDGTLSVVELASVAADRGLDYLAVTDHNTVSHFPELPIAAGVAGIQLIPGQEVTTDQGHAGVLGDVPWIDFRRPADTWGADTARTPSVMIANHPLAADCSWRHAHIPPVAEVWHWGWWDRTWGAPLAWAQAAGIQVAVGGGDFHRPEEGHPPGTPTTWVLCEEGQVVDAIADGRTAVSAGPGGPLLLRHGDDFLVVDADGLVLWGPDTRTVIRGDRVTLPARPGMHRLETYRNEVMALCT
ncbi:CehA/McbA family metallohydrolase [Streptosporangiaceae bacterium NEAU-GS5]|nr:CehA/McbA family metallohydrolase [Streptosporangiaceae bacterium NEAU-GS5]